MGGGAVEGAVLVCVCGWVGGINNTYYEISGAVQVRVNDSQAAIKHA